MEEIGKIISKYKDVDVSSEISSYEKLITFSGFFYQDVGEIYDVLTRLKNIQRNPTGYNFNDAAILGLLVRIWKLFKEIVFYYQRNNAQFLSLFERPIIEAAVIAKYLLRSDDSTVEDYRKCSYMARVNSLEHADRDPEFFATKAGIRFKESILAKMQSENLTLDSFEEQRKNRWKLSGKSFYKIFQEIEHKDFYKFLYGIPSEAIHGSWNESMDFDLARNNDGTFSVYPFYQEADIRYVTPLLKTTNEAYVLWLKRIQADDKPIMGVFDWINDVNRLIFEAFDKLYFPERCGKEERCS
jgi:hypothetical protein